MPSRADGGTARGAGTTIGVVGGSWRAGVNPWGAVLGVGGEVLLDWWVAAEDRWHTPAREASRRQRSVEGAPVVETAIRVPGGDAVQTVYAVADGGGLTVLVLENRSPASLAIALSRRDLLTSRAPADVPVRGGDAPPDALVLPVARRSAVTVALAHDPRGSGPLPTGLPTPDQVARGWQRQTGIGADLRLPEPAPIDLTALRSQLLLNGPPMPTDPVPFLVAVAELGRLGVDGDAWVDEVVTASEGLAGTMPRRSGPVVWTADSGLVAAGEVLARAGHRRGAADVAALRRRLSAPEPTPAERPEGVLALAWAQRRLVVERAGLVDLFPAPFPESWLGQPVEAHRLPVGDALLGLALRWHGARPALLWEIDGGAMTLGCSGLDVAWSTTERRGEALLSAPR